MFNMYSCKTKSSKDKLNNFLIISIDALHPKTLSKKNSPFIVSIMRKGVFTLKGKSTTPPKTLISHTAMFTGLLPEKSGYTSNSWQPGKLKISNNTIFNIAEKKGFHTGYFYSKEKLGFLINRKINKHRLSSTMSHSYAFDFIKEKTNNFVFLHISGLEYKGMDFGWFSQEYYREMQRIDKKIKPLLQYIINQKKFVIIITSDHAGHEKIHGTNHAEDYRLPFIFYSDIKTLNPLEKYSVHELYHIVKMTLK